MISNMTSGPITHVRHSNSISTENATYVALNHSLSVDLIFLDFYKTFDNASDQCLLKKLYHYGIKDNVYNWIYRWLAKGTSQGVIKYHCLACIYKESWLLVTSIRITTCN